jgi:hypothetical protein
MHSFALSLFAALFFGAVSSALPLPQSDDNVSNLVGQVVSLAGGTVKNAANAVPAGDLINLVTNTAGNALDIRDGPRSIPVIVAEVQSKLTPLTQPICKSYVPAFSWSLANMIP